VAKFTRLIHKVAIQLHLVASSYTICSSCYRHPVRKLLDTLVLNTLFEIACNNYVSYPYETNYSLVYLFIL